MTRQRDTGEYYSSRRYVCVLPNSGRPHIYIVSVELLSLIRSHGLFALQTALHNYIIVTLLGLSQMGFQNLT